MITRSCLLQHANRRTTALAILSHGEELVGIVFGGLSQYATYQMHQNGRLTTENKMKDTLDNFDQVQGLHDVHMLSYERVFCTLMSNKLNAFVVPNVWYASEMIVSDLRGNDPL